MPERNSLSPAKRRREQGREQEFCSSCLRAFAVVLFLFAAIPAPAFADCSALTNGVVALARFNSVGSATVFTQGSGTASAVVEGALAYDTVSDVLKVCDGTNWNGISGGSSQWTTTGSDIYYNTGNVGIGTTSPGGIFEVSKNATYSVDTGAALRLSNLATPSKMLAAGYDSSPDAGYIQALQSGGAYKPLLLNPNGGNVGIGTTSPQTTVDDAGMLRVSGCSPIATSGIGVETGYCGGEGYVIAYDRGGSIYKNLHLDGTKLILQTGSGGNVGIGTSSPDEKLTVAGVIRVSTGLPANPSGQPMCYGTQNGHTDTFGYCSSDARLKENVVPLKDGGLDMLMRLKPVWFEWKATHKLMAGFIAQDVQKTIPEAVYTQEKSDYLGLDTTAIVSYSVKAIQELKADNDNLRSIVEHQGEEIEALQAAVH